jgi:hypothetical protein
VSTTASSVTFAYLDIEVAGGLSEIQARDCIEGLGSPGPAEYNFVARWPRSMASSPRMVTDKLKSSGAEMARMAPRIGIVPLPDRPCPPPCACSWRPATSVRALSRPVRAPWSHAEHVSGSGVLLGPSCKPLARLGAPAGRYVRHPLDAGAARWGGMRGARGQLAKQIYGKAGDSCEVCSRLSFTRHQLS